MWDRASIKNEIYLRLNKSPATPGFFTPERVNSAIQESLDIVATAMFEEDNGWLKQLDYVDVEANQVTIPIPAHWEMLEEVRYQVGNIYMPLAYDAQYNTPQWNATSGATQLPNSYRIIGNSLYFNPPLGVGGEKFLQVEYQRYPSILRNDAQQADPQFGRALIWYCIYRACSICASSMGQFNKSWATEEAMWFEKMQDIVAKRNKQSVPIADFCGF